MTNYIKQPAWAVLPLILLVAFAVNSFTLQSQSLRLDEAQSIWVTTKSVPELLKITAEDVHVPLYFLLLHVWLQIFGTDVVVARSLSLVFFITSLFALYQLTKQVSNKKIAILSVVLFSFSPFIVWYSSESRMYSLFVLMSILNSIFFLKFLKSGGVEGKFGLFLSTLFGFLTHYFFLFLVAAQFLYLLTTKIIKVQKKRDFRVVFLFTALILMDLILFSPWIIYMIGLGFASNTLPMIPLPTSYNLFQTLVNFLFGFPPQDIQSIIISMWPFLVIIIFLIFTQKVLFRPSFMGYFFTIFFLPMILAFAASYVFKPLFLTRYLIFVSPFLFIITAWLLSSYAKKFTYVLSFVLIFFMTGLLFLQNTSASSPIRENYQSAVTYLEKKATPRDIIALSPPFTIYPVEYYYRGQTKVATIPDWDRFSKGGIPSFSIENLQEQIKKYQEQYLRVFVVFSYDQGNKKDVEDYFERNFHRLDMQTFSQNLEIRVYRLRYDVDLPI
ncbi:glycosyltransferase family 39 protein [Candidatus Daviesbacteria bacterium]|nr:glycosyltransferase family 39 protein [Candidatus Daviesbacteria bacterium]